MKKILLFGATPHQGGIETFILNICKIMSSNNKVYLYNFSSQDLAYQQILIDDYHVKIFQRPAFNGKLGHFLRRIQYRLFFKKYQFDIVHINANSPSNYDFAKAAIRSGAKVIYHSHNDSAESFVLNPKFTRLISIIRSFQRTRLAKLSVERLAVSTRAAEWMFNDSKRVTIIPNGVDFEKLKFSSEKRITGRKQLDINSDDKVLLVASRLTPQKNIYKSLMIARCAIDQDVVQHLIIVGDGPEYKVLNSVIADFPKHIQEKIHIQGAQNDMQFWYSVSDILIMPSLYEGLPYSVLEAQANGVSVVASKAIPNQAIIVNRLVHILDVNQNDVIWINDLIDCNIVSSKSRVECLMTANESIYSLNNFKNIMEKIYGTV